MISRVMFRTMLSAGCSILAVFGGGCADLGRSVGNVFSFRPDYINTAGQSVRGRDIEYSAHGAGERTVLVIGAIHGDEQASMVLVKRLQEYLVSEQPEFLNNTRVVVMANTNPDGIKAGTRENANGVDLNRNFPAGNRINCPEFGMSGFSEPESTVIAKIIYEYEPNLIISVHQPYGCIDYDGDAADVAMVMAKQAGLEVRKLGPMPGSLGTFSSQMLGIPIITFELPEGAETLEPFVLWELYKPALLAGIEY